jgi:HlyD family secretion protein
MADQLSSDLASLRIDRDAPPPGGGLVKKLVVAAVVLGAIAGAYAYGAPAVEARLFKTEVTVTEISRLSPAQASIDLTASGYVVPERTAKVGAKLVGRITKRTVKEGDAVKAGQVLFELDPADQQSAVTSARAKAMAAEARAKAAKANVMEVKVQLERTQKLVESGSVGRAQAEDLSARLAALDEAAHAAEAEAKAAGTEIGVAAVGLRNLSIVAPIDGTVVGKPVELGDVVSPTDALAQLVDLSSLVVEVDVPEARLFAAKKSAPCEIVLDSAPDKRFRGEVLEITPRVNRSKATVVVKVKFVDRAEIAFPDMAARVSFLAKAIEEKALKEPPKTVIPASAVVDRAGGKVVFAVESGKVRMLPVTLGAPFGEGFEIKDGPPPGTKVVKNPPATLADGQAVKERTDA